MRPRSSTIRLRFRADPVRKQVQVTEVEMRQALRATRWRRGNPCILNDYRIIVIVEFATHQVRLSLTESQIREAISATRWRG